MSKPKRPDPKKLAASKAALRARMAAKRPALQARMKANRAAMAERLAAVRAKRKKPPAKKSRFRWLWLLLLLLLLLCIICCCSCSEEPEPPAEEVAEPVPVEVVPEEPPVPAAPPMGGRVDRRARPDFAPVQPKELAWIAAFRLQVVARSGRLAPCFVGVDQPGALKWTAAVEPVEGKVSDHTLEPTLASDSLTSEQRNCVIGVLSSPSYVLEVDEARSTPSRVGMVIEF